jgi:NAD(P)H-dependent FMN reductase
MSAIRLKTVVFMGSAKTLQPAWGGPERLGDCVLNFVVSTLKARGEALGSSDVKVAHDVHVLDPVEIFGEGGALQSSGAEIRTPHFYFKPGGAPPAMDALRNVIKDADCFVIVTAEYNHCVPPGLLGLLGTFGGSNYAGKPSGIVTYSPGPFGGSRASIALQPVLHELGALPVSKIVSLASPSDMLTPEGAVKDDPPHRMLKQLPAMLNQLEWLACAMKKQRDTVGMWA